MSFVPRIILASALLLVACKKEPPVAAGDDASTAGATVAEAPQHVQDLIANFQRVHFAFDSSSLTPESQEALAANAKIMQSHPKVRVQIQGHADERGTSDYNLALGDRRAKIVLDALVSAGVSPQRLDTISYGEEAPIDAAHTETAWSKNRRAEFVVLWGQGASSSTSSSTSGKTMERGEDESGKKSIER